MATSEWVILVVEDCSEDAELIRVAFRRAGFDNPVHIVNDPDAALRYLKGEGEYANRETFPFPRLVILDHKMPGDALEVVRWVRKRPHLNLLPVVILTGSADPNYEKEGYEAGANAYHVKPQTLAEFVAVIKRVAEFWLMGGGISRLGKGEGLKPQGSVPRGDKT
jgi:CheY-like chemotaxis protein